MTSQRPPPGLALVTVPAATPPSRHVHAALSLVPTPRARVRLATADGLVSITATAWSIPVRPVPWRRT
jgi:hypothetical protein